MPRWPNWALRWIVPLALPPSTCGCANWVGPIKKTLFATEQNRADVAKQRAEWHQQLSQEPVTALVFVDESGATTKLSRLRARSPEGQRAVGRVPHGHYQTTRLLASACAGLAPRGSLRGRWMGRCFWHGNVVNWNQACPEHRRRVQAYPEAALHRM